MLLKKNIKVGKIKFYLIIFVLSISLFFSFNLNSEDDLEGVYTDIKVLDKISSKNTLIKLKNGQEIKFKDQKITSKIKMLKNDLIFNNVLLKPKVT